MAIFVDASYHGEDVRPQSILLKGTVVPIVATAVVALEDFRVYSLEVPRQHVVDNIFDEPGMAEVTLVDDSGAMLTRQVKVTPVANP